MEGYVWAIAAGLNAALAAISAKFFASQVKKTLTEIPSLPFPPFDLE